MRRFARVSVLHRLARSIVPVAFGSALSLSMAVAATSVVPAAASRPEPASTSLGAPLAASSSSLPAGSSLAAGQILVAPGGRYRLAMQRDGNLVLYWLSKAIWETNTEGHGGAHASMQRDGNFVVYLGKAALWSSRTGGHPAAAFLLSALADGDVVITAPGGAEIWSSKTESAGVRIEPESSPAFAGDAGDPDVVRDGTTYYAFTTGTPLGNHIQALVSSTPASGWHSYTNTSYGSTALPDPPSWEEANSQTSPGVFEYDGHWVMFYDASLSGHRQGSGYDCISVAIATTLTPTSPVFSDHSGGPLICQQSYGGVLDPTPFVNRGTGKAYVLWKSNDGSSSQPSHIWSQELNAAGTGVVGAAVELLTNDTARFPWETTLDDPSMANANDRDLLIFSVGNYLSSAYSEAFATCTGPTGPCTQPAGNPFLETYGHAYGPAGGSLFTDASGNWWIDYAAWNSSSCQNYSCGAVRSLYVAPIALGG